MEGTENDREDALLKVGCSEIKIPTEIILVILMICAVLLKGTARCRNPAGVYEGWG